ncbi:hypothetical protein BDW02DRAFT_261431 [Decorospora gaudefroyi]|uniref:Uncharacterized protein n=1 Tax=Decorospora gaudefroyi TaxID=184978 RepID=A0A6A5KJQ7_9PLEO|nr:hypothetical protein BDW02DRAFT_261431 [Decorospora gaudefroyi]
MSGVKCCWASIPEDAIEWWENDFIPARTKNAIYSLHCEFTENGMDEDPVGRLDAPWPHMTIYETADVNTATKTTYDKSHHPSDDMLAGPLKDARFDIRTYRELMKWQAEGWATECVGDDIEDIASVAVMEWRATSSKEAEIYAYFSSVVGPRISASPDVLRFRIFTIDNATVLHGGEYRTKEKDELYKYFTLVELESEQWPWDVVVELAQDERWQAYFEAHKDTDWRLSHYLVKRAYRGASLAAAGGSGE